MMLRAAISLIALSWSTRADTTSATCTSALWTFNHEGQSPCLVGALLQGPCFNHNWSVPALPANHSEIYSGAVAGFSNKCQCNTVTYSVMSACDLCQGVNFGTWTKWAENCNQTHITIADYPAGISAIVSVPVWAFQDVTIEGQWDSTLSENIASNSSSPPDKPLATPSGTTITSPTSSAAGKAASHAGAIAGGVVGGLVGLAAIVLASVLLYRRKTQQTKVTRVSSINGGEKIDLDGRSMATSGMDSGGYSYHAGYNLVSNITEPLRIYDPSDPSTFPSTPAPTIPSMYEGTVISGVTRSSGPTSASGTPGHARLASDGSHPGLPEI